MPHILANSALHEPDVPNLDLWVNDRQVHHMYSPRVFLRGIPDPRTKYISKISIYNANRTRLLTCETAGIRIHVVMTRLITVIVPKQITRSDLCTLEEHAQTHLQLCKDQWGLTLLRQLTKKRDGPLVDCITLINCLLE
ncbi:uncharacterized protein H6S33_003903 [Morchella sextelata]|uniref:uncharacterized protein n=1 Tax=Morchella sextelata TaxID=1174677 RepID=UPI001D044986|nr:uncharacterized protein H6S33_003903 [Morchella sextelata]KAH0606242.1 hypothetical protein H6S33_003903 [Morchella sextelata]